MHLEFELIKDEDKGISGKYGDWSSRTILIYA